MFQEPPSGEGISDGEDIVVEEETQGLFFRNWPEDGEGRIGRCKALDSGVRWRGVGE